MSKDRGSRFQTCCWDVEVVEIFARALFQHVVQGTLQVLMTKHVLVTIYIVQRALRDISCSFHEFNGICRLERVVSSYS
jgi:hypothetical protein